MAMTPTERRVRFLLRYLYAAENELESLRAELKAYLSGERGRSTPVKAFGPIQATVDREPDVDELSMAQLLSLQRELREFVNQAFLSTTTTAAQRATVGLEQINLTLFPLTHVGRRRGFLPLAYGSARDMLLLSTFFLLTMEATEPIRQCPDPQCGVLFYRHRKQVYCGQRCMGRAVKRRWRNSAKGRKAEAGRKRRRYDRRHPIGLPHRQSTRAKKRTD
jgi:predicted RNA-binding Zn ribbon-like protein